MIVQAMRFYNKSAVKICHPYFPKNQKIHWLIEVKGKTYTDFPQISSINCISPVFIHQFIQDHSSMV
jgi:hypothetical protein